MITPWPEKKIPVTSFNLEGRSVYAFKHNGHCFFNVCSCDDYCTIFEDDKEKKEKERLQSRIL